MTIPSVKGSPPTATGEGATALVKVPPPPSSRPIQKATVEKTNAPNPTPAQTAKAATQVNNSFTKSGQNLQAVIELDKASGINVVKIQDKSTNEVISQFPPKAIVAMAEAINQSLDKKGQMLDVNA